MDIFERTPDSPLDQALTLRESGDIEGAIALLYSAVSEALTDRGLVITLAKMLAETDQLDKAEHWFRHAHKIAPGDLDVAGAYGTFLAQTGRLAEARLALESARHRARTLTESEPEARGLLCAIELNLGRVCLELRDFEAARELVRPWLADEQGWDHAHDVFVDLAMELDLDPVALDEERLASGHISPLMVCHRLEDLLEATPPDLLDLERVVARADALFDFDWRHAAPELEEVLARGRQAAVHALMRGTLTPELIPHLLGHEDEDEDTSQTSG
jgi:tetratricopeptide (TPR) repeat protein